MADTLTTTPFSKQCEFVVEGYSGTTELTDFPVLVRLSESANSPVGFKYADCQSGGADLRFADADGILLPHEIETWDPSGESLVWVRLSSLEGTKTKFFAYYGASSAVAQSVPASDTWSSYVTVIHGGSSISDSSPSALTLTANSVTTNSTGVVGGGMSKSTRNAKGVNIPNPYKMACSRTIASIPSPSGPSLQPQATPAPTSRYAASRVGATRDFSDCLKRGTDGRSPSAARIITRTEKEKFPPTPGFIRRSATTPKRGTSPRIPTARRFTTRRT